jgi:hypothetical protein
MLTAPGAAVTRRLGQKILNPTRNVKSVKTGRPKNADNGGTNEKYLLFEKSRPAHPQGPPENQRVKGLRPLPPEA